MTLKVKLVDLKRRIKALEDNVGALDGKKPRKKRGKKKKVYTLDNIPTCRGFGGKKILKDGTWGEFTVSFGKVYKATQMTRKEELNYMRHLRANMIKNFGEFNTRFEDTIKTVMVDMPRQYRKPRKKKGGAECPATK
ncbi:MAG: hypothetical protein ACYTBJ_00675 [Planctomycetota bacterium]|jgi:hypothetical protein